MRDNRALQNLGKKETARSLAFFKEQDICSILYFIYGAFICQVTCVGQVIGVIVAETQAQAQRAAKMVKITYEELPRILTIEVKNTSTTQNVNYFGGSHCNTFFFLTGGNSSGVILGIHANVY